MTYFILTWIKDLDKKELIEDIIEPGMGSLMKGPLERPFSSFSPGRENNWHLKSLLFFSLLWLGSNFVIKCYKFYHFHRYNIFFSLLAQALVGPGLPYSRKSTTTTYPFFLPRILSSQPSHNFPAVSSKLCLPSLFFHNSVINVLMPTGVEGTMLVLIHKGN